MLLVMGVAQAHTVACVATPNKLYVAVTGRKRTLFHCRWANSISYISRMLY